MRVVQACPYAWDAAGGVQSHVRQLAGHLRTRGHDVLVVAPAFSPPAAAETGLRVAGRPLRIPYNGSIAPISPRPSTLRAVGRAIAEFEPDVVHVHEPFTPSVSMAAVLRSKAPVVATFHAFAARSRLRDLATPALRPVWRRLAVRIAVSEAAASFAGRGLDDGLVIVPNGVDLEPFADASPAAGLPEGRRLLFVNRLEPRKGFRVAAEAFGLLAADRPDVVLVVAGDGEERDAVRDLPPDVRARVAMLGTVDHDRLPPYHAASEVFVGSARGNESFGIVLVEAMAAGLPVVASDIPGYREVVRDGVDGVLVPPSDPVALASALGGVLDDADLADRLREAGTERARTYSWDRVAGRIEVLYAGALAAK
ncbi:MAG TPA: glycosyltransferase family 4 protein [Actinomycetota bacterium]|nr:glycosyltransferase family 4 protein [Actinomycetota bacterium]